MVSAERGVVGEREATVQLGSDRVILDIYITVPAEAARLVDANSYKVVQI